MPKAKKPKTRKPKANKPIIYDELTWTEAQKLVKGGMDMAIMPTGATEQHGPRLPMNVAYLVAYRIALGVSEQTGVPVFPPIPIGHSGGHVGIPGTLSLRPETFQKVIEEVGEWAYATGFRRILFLNGHLPNIHPLNCAMVNLRVQRPDLKLQAISWWDISPELQDHFYIDESYGVPHGNIVETAIMRYFRDDLVNMKMAKLKWRARGRSCSSTISCAKCRAPDTAGIPAARRLSTARSCTAWRSTGWRRAFARPSPKNRRSSEAPSARGAATLGAGRPRCRPGIRRRASPTRGCCFREKSRTRRLSALDGCTSRWRVYLSSRG